MSAHTYCHTSLRDALLHYISYGTLQRSPCPLTDKLPPPECLRRRGEVINQESILLIVHPTATTCAFFVSSSSVKRGRGAIRVSISHRLTSRFKIFFFPHHLIPPEVVFFLHGWQFTILFFFIIVRCPRGFFVWFFLVFCFSFGGPKFLFCWIVFVRAENCLLKNAFSIF